MLAERTQDYFELDRESPYMLIVAGVRKERRQPTNESKGDDMLPIVRQVRSDIPAVTHVDYSARIQTVVRDDHAAYYDLIKRFEELTGSAVIVNTSFNVRGEPIVCTPENAYRCFMRTGMTILALGNYVLLKEEQPPWPEGNADGLESEDAAKVESGSPPDALTRKLASLFRNEFLPLANALRAKRVVLVDPTFRDVRSTWSNVESTLPSKEVFEFPVELGCARPDPQKFAAALVRCWKPGAATDALLPLLARLVEVGLRYPPIEALDEEVPDSVYVMF